MLIGDRSVFGAAAQPAYLHFCMLNHGYAIHIATKSVDYNTLFPQLYKWNVFSGLGFAAGREEVEAHRAEAQDLVTVLRKVGNRCQHSSIQLLYALGG